MHLLSIDLKLKTSFLIVISLLVLSSLFMPVSQAYQLKHTISGLQNVKRTDTKICYHSSGKIIYAILNPSSTIRMYVYSSLMNYQGGGNVVGDTLYDISIAELDNDEIIIFGVQDYYSICYYKRLIVYRFNIVSYSFSAKYTVDIMSCGNTPSENDGNLGSIYKYLNNFYVSGNSRMVASGANLYFIFAGKFVPTTNTVTISSSSPDEKSAHPIYDFRNSTVTYNQFVYVLTSTKTDHTAQFYVMDMSALTLTFLTNYPAGGTFPNSRRINLLGAGIHEEGDIKYLYFTWEYSYVSASVRNIRVCQSRSIYNITITSETLLVSGRSEAIISPNLATSSEVAWSIGISTIKENATIYYVNIIDSVYHISKSELYVADWLDYGDFDAWTIGDFTAIADDELDITWGAQITNLIIYTPTGNVEVLENQGNTELYLITPLYIEYDITLSYTPVDNPLITDTSYIFTITTYANAIPTAEKIIGYGDNSQFASGITGSNGQYQFTMTTSVGGMHTITIKLYDLNNVLRRTESFDYLFKKISTGTDITQEDALTIGMNSLFGMLPQFIIVLLPAILVYQVKNDAIMFMVGLTIGSAIGVLSGIIPLYILFIFVLCDLLVIFYMRRESVTTGE